MMAADLVIGAKLRESIIMTERLYESPTNVRALGITSAGYVDVDVQVHPLGITLHLPQGASASAILSTTIDFL